MSDNAAKFIMYGMFSLGIAFVFGLVLNAALRPPRLPRAVAQEPRDHYQIIVPKDADFESLHVSDNFLVFNTNTGELWHGRDSKQDSEFFMADRPDMIIGNLGDWMTELKLPKEK